MIAFPNAKINLGLNIINKRTDGYHNIETVFFPIPFYDVLEIVKNNNSNTDAVEFSSSGLTVDGDFKDNLCFKAYQLLKKDFPHLPPVKMHLHKAIPAGAGLGGGSADAAVTLQILNKNFNLNLSGKELHYYALQLGSDCPFFLLNKPAFAQERGEKLQLIDFSLRGYKVLIINPNININTGWAFSRITPFTPQKSLTDIIKLPVNEWKNFLVNDFEKPVFNHYPQLKEVKQKLYEIGAIYVSMSGSGSTLFGLYQNEIKMSSLFFPQNYLVKEIAL